jgi:hypothetical protein
MQEPKGKKSSADENEPHSGMQNHASSQKKKKTCQRVIEPCTSGHSVLTTLAAKRLVHGEPATLFNKNKLGKIHSP